MFDMGWSELLVIGVVALIVVGPKDLPILFRRVGQFVGKAKGMAREFSSAMNQAADQAGVADVKKSLQAAANPMKTGLDSVKSAAKDLSNLDPDSETGKLAAERLEAKKKIEAATAKRASERIAAEKAAEAAKAREQADPSTPQGEAPLDEPTKENS